MKGQYVNDNKPADDMDEVLRELDSLVRSLGETIDGTVPMKSEPASTEESIDLETVDLGPNVELYPMGNNEGSFRIFDSIRKKLEDLDSTSTKIELYLSELAAAVNH